MYLDRMRRTKKEIRRQERVRERFDRFAGAEGHGAVQKAANDIDVSRSYLSAFRNGGMVSDELLEKLSRYLDKWEASQYDDSEDPFDAIADELEALIVTLRSPTVEDSAKVDRINDVVLSLHAAQESLSVEFTSPSEGQN